VSLYKNYNITSGDTKTSVSTIPLYWLAVYNIELIQFRAILLIIIIKRCFDRNVYDYIYGRQQSI